ncbi:hypothetical protein BT69DRAFT_1328499 [Atractiella rhizophila]|nr:hypothetical protein BT69DRAFT_1328499 [Atractiella rhizophila]
MTRANTPGSSITTTFASIADMFKKVNGSSLLPRWYHIGPKLHSSDREINEVIKRGVEYLLRDVTSLSSHSDASLVHLRPSSLHASRSRLLEISDYLKQVLLSKMEMNTENGCLLQDIFKLLPGLEVVDEQGSGTPVTVKHSNHVLSLQRKRTAQEQVSNREQEREELIQHGTVFVFEEGKSGMMRWTDHLKGALPLTTASICINRQVPSATVERWHLVAYYNRSIVPFHDSQPAPFPSYSQPQAQQQPRPNLFGRTGLPSSSTKHRKHSTSSHADTSSHSTPKSILSRALRWNKSLDSSSSSPTAPPQSSGGLFGKRAPSPGRQKEQQPQQQAGGMFWHEGRHSPTSPIPTSRVHFPQLLLPLFSGDALPILPPPRERVANTTTLRGVGMGYKGSRLGWGWGGQGSLVSP